MTKDSSKLLINEHPLQALPTLAREIGLNKAVILQQVQYWISTSPHDIEGNQWIYNSYTEWAQQFPWLKPQGVRWHIRKLEELGLLIAGEFNKDARDNTKWYRINYDRLNELLNTTSGVLENSTPTATKQQVQVLQTHQPLPETTTKNTTEKHSYGEFSNVLLTIKENEKLETKFGLEGAAKKIEELSSAIESKGYKYKSHYATILNWDRRDNGSKPEGKTAGVNRINSADPDKYVKGPYGHMVQR